MAKSFAYLNYHSEKTFKITNHIGADSFRLPIYVSTTGLTEKEHSVDWSANEKCFMVYSVKGCGRVLIHGKWELLPEGSLVYIPTTETVIYEPLDDTVWSTAYITFGGRLAESLCGTKPIIIKSEELNFFPEAIRSLSDKLGKTEWFEYSSSLLYYILLRFNRITENRDEPVNETNPIRKKIINSVKYVNEHFSHDLSLPFLAEQCGITEEYYCRLFKEYTGATPTAYINSLRIAHACDLIKSDKSESLSTICEKCGYRSLTYFSRVFKKEIGMTPGEFRKKNI